MRNPYLTRGMEHALFRLFDEEMTGNWEDAEIVQEGIVCYIGLTRIHAGTVNRLLRLCLVSEEDCMMERSMRRFTLNEDGRGCLRDSSWVPSIVSALKARGK